MGRRCGHLLIDRLIGCHNLHSPIPILTVSPPPPAKITQVQAERLQGKKPSLLAEEGEEGEDFVFVQVCVWVRAK